MADRILVMAPGPTRVRRPSTCRSTGPPPAATPLRSRPRRGLRLLQDDAGPAPPACNRLEKPPDREPSPPTTLLKKLAGCCPRPGRPLGDVGGTTSARRARPST